MFKVAALEAGSQDLERQGKTFKRLKLQMSIFRDRYVVICIFQNPRISLHKGMGLLKVRNELFVLLASWNKRSLKQNWMAQNTRCKIDSRLDLLSIFPNGFFDIKYGQSMCNHEEYGCFGN